MSVEAEPAVDSIQGQDSRSVWLTAQRIHVFIWLFVLLGAAARLIRYLLRFPLWEDEAFLAYNLMTRDFAGLLQPLDYLQVAPLGYLWVQRGILDLLGFTEYALRLTALLAGLGSLLVFRRVARLTLSPLAQLAAVAIFAVSYPMIRYSAEAKQYGLDLFLGLSLVWCFLEWRRTAEKKRWLWAMLVMALTGPFLSHPLVFIGGGVSFAWAWQWRHERRLAPWLCWIGFNALLGGAFLAHFLLSQPAMGQANSTFMHDFWRLNFPPLDDALALARWLVLTHAGEFLAFPFGSGKGGSTLTLLSMIGGVAILVRRRQGLLLGLVFVPLALHLVAAALQRFPYGGHVKFSMYWAPLGVLLMGTALAALYVRFEPSLARRRPVLIALAVLALPALGCLARDLIRPAKTTSDLHGRDFARWFWSDMPHESVLVCLQTDLHRTFSKNMTERLNWSASFACNQKIYSRRHARGEQPDWSRVSATTPLRCVEFRVDGLPYDEAARNAWLEDMSQRYHLVAHDRYPLPRYRHDTHGLICVDFVEVYKFLPRSSAAAPAR